MKEVAKHFLNSFNSLKAIQQAVKNILNSVVDEQLQMLCKALDAYWGNIIKEREAATTGREQAEVETERQTSSRRRAGAGLTFN